MKNFQTRETPKRSPRPSYAFRALAAATAFIVAFFGLLTTDVASASAVDGLDNGYDYTFYITDIRRGADITPGDGVCLTVSGTCTMDAAIQEANALGVAALGGDPNRSFLIVPAPTFTVPVNPSGAANSATTQQSSGTLETYYGRQGTANASNPQGINNAASSTTQTAAATGRAVYDGDYTIMYDVRAQVTIDLQNRMGWTSNVYYDWANTPIIFNFRGENQVLRNVSEIGSPEAAVYAAATAKNFRIENSLIWSGKWPCANCIGITTERGVTVVGGAENTTISNVRFDGMYINTVLFLSAANGSAINGVTIDRSEFTNENRRTDNNDQMTIGDNVTVNGLSITNSLFENTMSNSNAETPIRFTNGTINDLVIKGNTFRQTNVPDYNTYASPRSITLSTAGSNRLIAQNNFVWAKSFNASGNYTNAWIDARFTGTTVPNLTIRDNMFSGGKNAPQVILGDAAAKTIPMYRNTMSGVGGTTPGTANENNLVENFNIYNYYANKQVRTAWPSSAVAVDTPIQTCRMDVGIAAPLTSGTGSAPAGDIYVDAYIGRTAANGGDGMGLEQYLGRIKTTAAELPKTASFFYTGAGNGMTVRLQTTEIASGATSQFSRLVNATGADTCAPETWIKQGGSFTEQDTVTSTQEDPTSWRDITFEIESSEPLGSNTLDASDIKFSGTAPGAQVVSLEQISETRWVLTAKANGSGTVVPSIPAGAINDAAGNVSVNPSNTRAASINFAGYTDADQMVGVAGSALDHSVTYVSPLAITAPDPRRITVAEPGTAASTYRVEITERDATGRVSKAPMYPLVLKQQWVNLVADPSLPTPGQAADSIAKTMPTNTHLSDVEPTLDTIQSYVDVPVYAVDNSVVDGTRSVTLTTQVQSDDYEYDGLLIDDLDVTVQDDDAAEAVGSVETTATNNALANGTAKNLVRATVKNAAGTVVSNATVSFTLPAGVTYTPATGDTVAGPATVKVLSNAAGQADLPLTSLLGNKAFTVAAAVNGDQTITGSPASVTFTPVPVEAGTSSFSVSTGTKVADNAEAHTITVKLTNQIGNPAGGFADDISAAAAPAADATVGDFTEVAGEDGTYTAPITSSVAGVKTITVSVNGAPVALVNPAGQNTAAFVAGAPQVGEGLSSLALSADTRVANNTDAHTATVTLKDANGNPVIGKAGALTAAAIPATGVTIGAFVPSSDGVYVAQVTSTVAGDPRIAVVFDAAGANLALGDGPVSFVPGAVSAGSSALTTSTDTRIAGVETHDAAVLVTDAQGNPITGQTVVFTSGATMAPANGSVVSGADGVARVTLSSNAAGEFAVAATIGGNAVADSPASVSFVAGEVSFAEGATRLSGTTGSAEANGEAQHSATVTVTDALDNPIADATVVFSVPAALSATGSLTQQTDANGRATLTVTSTVAGTHGLSATVNGTAIPAANGNPLAFTFVNGAASAEESSWKITPDGPVTANGTDAYTATVSVSDTNGNAVADQAVSFTVPAGVTLTEDGPFVSNSSGIVEVHFTSTHAEEFAVSAHIGADRIGDEKTIVFAAGEPAFGEGASALSATTGTQTADGTQAHTATVVVRDEHGNPVKDASVAFTVAAPAAAVGDTTVTSNASGVATISVVSAEAGTFDVTATVNGTDVTTGSPASVTFVAGAPSAGSSAFAVTPNGTVTANGEDAFTATATVRDAQGNPVEGVTVGFAFDAAVTGAPTATTNADGVATTELTSVSAGSYTVSATIGASQIGDTADIVFGAGGPSFAEGATALSATTGSKLANGTAAHTATVVVLDEHGNPVQDASVEFAVEAPATPASATTVLTTSSGRATVSVISATAGTFDVTARVNGTDVTNGSPATVSFVAGEIDLSKTALTIPTKDDNKTANTTDEHIARVTVLDENSNPIEGADVVFAVEGDTTFAPVATTNSEGVAETRITSAVAQTATVTATIGGDAVANNGQDIRFIAGAPSAAHSTFSVSPGTAEANGSATHYAQVIVRDAQGNPVRDAVVDFEIGAGARADETATSDEDGVARVLITSTKAGSYAAAGSIGGDAVGDGTVQFVSGAASASTSTWTVTPNGPVAADGTASYEAVITVNDAEGNPVQNAEINLDTDAGVRVAESAPFVSGTDGTVTVHFTATVAGEYSVSALLGADTIGSPQTITFVAGPVSLSTSTIVATPTIAEANGEHRSEVIVTLLDKDGNRVLTAGNTVAISTDRGVASSTENLGDGTYRAFVTSLTAGTATVSFTVSDAAANAQAEVTFVKTPLAPSVNPSNGTSVSGIADPGAIITVTNAAGETIGSGVAGPDGAYSVQVTEPVEHGETLTIVASDVNGFESAPVPVTVDSEAPAAPTVNPSNGTVVYGTAEPGSTVTLYGPDDEVLGTVLVGDSGTYEFTFDPALENGLDVRLTATDSAGNESGNAALSIDGNAVVAPTVDPSNGTTIGGTGEAGNTITVTLPGGETVTTEVGEDGRWSITPPAGTEFEHGDTVTVTEKNDAGTVSPPTVIQIDKEAPGQPAVDPSNGHSITGGPVEDGATVTFVDGSGTPIPGTVTVDEDGYFVFEPETPLTEDNVVKVIVTDAAGNPSDALLIEVDTIAPDAPVVNPTDGSSVTGEAEKGSTVTVTNPETGEVIGEVTVDENGTFVIDFNPALPDGTEIVITVTDPAGNTSEPTTVVTDSTAPEAPVVNPTDGSSVTGEAEKGSTVTVTDPETGEVLGEVKVDEDGTFVVDFNPALPDGTEIVITVTDPAGNTSEPTTVVTDSTAPEAPVVNPTDGSSVTGEAEKGSTVTVTNPETGEVVGEVTVDENGNFVVDFNPALPDGTEIVITVTDPAGNTSEPTTVVTDSTAPEVPVVNPTDGSEVTGKGEEGGTVTITNPETGEVLCTTTITDGTFSCVLDPALPDGTPIEITVTDPAGNTSEPTVVVTDSTAPEVPVVNPTDGSSVTGEAEKGATVTVTDPETGEVLGEVKVDEDGTFVIDFNPALPDGTEIVITVTDPAGNTSEPTTVVTDSTAPEVPVVNPTDGSEVTGKGEEGGTVTITNPETGEVLCTTTIGTDGTFTCVIDPALPDGTEIEVTVTDPAGNTSEPETIITDSTAPEVPVVNPTDGSEVTGKGEEGGTVTITNPETGEVLCTTTIGTDGTFTCVIDPALPDGTEIEVTVTDPAGNTSEPETIITDSTAPEAPVVNPTDGSSVTGEAEKGGTVTITNPETGEVLGEAKVDEDGTFVITLNPALPDGTPIEITVTDPAGNTSEPTVVVTDSTAPEAPVVDPTDGSEVSGTGEDGGTVTVTNPETGEVLCTTTITNGTFSCVLDPALPDGTEIEVTVTDPAGNTSEPETITTDSTAPVAPVVAPSNGTVVYGTAEAGAIVNIYNEAGNSIGTTRAGEDGKFSVSFTPQLGDGVKLTVSATDVAGNESIRTPLTIDGSAVVAPRVDPTNGTVFTGHGDAGFTITVTLPDSSTVTTTVGLDGTWSITPPAGMSFEDGDTVSVTQTNPAGTVSPSTVVTIDKTSPEAPVVDPTDGSEVTGSGEEGGTVTITNPETGEVICETTIGEDGRFTCVIDPALPDGTEIEITVTDPAGNTSEPETVVTDSAAPEAAVVNDSNGKTVTGSNIEKGAVVTAVDGAGNPVPGTMVVDEDGTFVFTPTTPLREGDEVQIVVTDAAGNSSDPITVLIDTTPPTAPTVNPSDGTSVTGGTIDANDILTVVDGSGNPIPGTTVVDGAGNFTFIPDTPLAEGDVVKVVVTDSVGNPVEVRVDIDTTKPGAPVVDPTEGDKVTGCAEPGSTVTIYDAEGTVIGTAVAGADCRFETILEPAQKPGTDITIVVTDPSGNESERVVIRVGLTSLLLQSAELEPGATQVAYGYGFQPGEVVSGVLHSEPIDLGTQVADADGDVIFEFTIPAGFELGAHTVTLSGTFSGAVSESFTVANAPAPETPVLTVTGTEMLLPLGGAMLLLVAGAWFLVAKRRRENTDAA